MSLAKTPKNALHTFASASSTASSNSNHFDRSIASTTPLHHLDRKFRVRIQQLRLSNVFVDDTSSTAFDSGASEAADFTASESQRNVIPLFHANWPCYGC
jgi:hypothetical protein